MQSEGRRKVRVLVFPWGSACCTPSSLGSLSAKTTLLELRRTLLGCCHAVAYLCEGELVFQWSRDAHQKDTGHFPRLKVTMPIEGCLYGLFPSRAWKMQGTVNVVFAGKKKMPVLGERRACCEEYRLF